MKTDTETTDVLVIGAGAAGLAAGLAAAQGGARVVVVDENTDVGGHAIVSGGWVELGGGTEVQRANGIHDTPEQVYADWYAQPASRYDDPDIVAAFAAAGADTVDFLVDAGVLFSDVHVLTSESGADTPRRFRVREWPHHDDVPVPGRAGAGLIRPIQRAALELEVDIRTGYQFHALTTDPADGRVTGAVLGVDDRTISITAGQGVVLATGGHSSNVDFRRLFDPRLGEVYQTVGEPYSRQTAASELAALDVGGTLWGVGAQTRGSAHAMSKTTSIGCRWGYRNLIIGPDSSLFAAAKATGIGVHDWSDVILVKGAGHRFHDESADNQHFIEAALDSGADPAQRSGSAVWAMFDAAHAARAGWQLDAPWVDRDGYFFEADSWSELAERVRPAFGTGHLDGDVLTATVERYNTLVAEGSDRDFGKRGLSHQLLTPPFYAAWATPMIHDSLTGVRTDRHGRVLRIDGSPIGGLYAAGECQGGFSQHGLGRALTFGRLAGLAAAAASPR